MGKSLKGKELGVGISQRKDGLYQGSFTNYFGCRKFCYGKTLKEVSAKLAQMKHEDSIGLSTKPQDYTLDEWFNFWIVTYKNHCRNTTISNYKSIYYKHISCQLGDMKINKLSPLLIQKVIDNMDSECMKIKSKIILKDLFKWAKNLKMIPENYIDYVHVKKYESNKNKRFLSNDEINLIKKYGENRKIYPFFIIGLDTGMRGGEIAGLKWKDVDFDNSIIHVRTTYVYKTSSIDKILIKEDHIPKTKKGIRDIPMTDKVINVLKSLNNNLNTQDDYVFKTRNGKPLPLSNVNKAFDLIINTINKKEKIQLSKFSSHALRRTFATNAIKNGMNPKTLQYILGHSSYNTTMDIYCQLSLETVIDEMKVVNW